MSPASGPVLVTGANGFLGWAVCRHLHSAGFEVRVLVRRPEDWRAPDGAAKIPAFRFELAGETDEGAFTDHPAALIHCARSTESSKPSSAGALDLHGLDSLLALSRRHACRRFVFISSLSAHPDAQSHYGRSKLTAEARLDHGRDLVLRPGLIIGPGGLFGRMRSSIARMPLVPLFFGGRQRIQHIALDDVCTAVERALALDLVGTLDVAHPDATEIRAFYQAVASSVGRDCRFIRLPGPLFLALLRFIERQSRFTLPITSENLLGLKAMRVFDTRASLKQLGIEPLGLQAALARLPKNPVDPAG